MSRRWLLVGLAALAVSDAAARAGPVDANRALFGPIVKLEAEKAGMPADVADAVVSVESAYDPSRIGGVGEIGLMQVRPETAAVLGFKGTADELAAPEVNIHFGVAYLSQAWRRAGGDLCRALMKYRAGHGEERMSVLSVRYCERARAHLASIGSPEAAAAIPPVDFVPAPAAAFPVARPRPPARVVRGRDGALIVQRPVRTEAVSAAFWAAHEARIRSINRRLERRARVIDSKSIEHDVVRKPVPTFRHHAPDHDVVGSNRSNDINVIDSKGIEHDVVRKPVPTFRHHAVASAR